MSEEAISKQKLRINEWQTSKVILYPTRATVVRQLAGVQLKPGLNELTISDLTSLADPDSIRVSGTTANHHVPARINDLTVDLVPNSNPVLPGKDFDDYDDDEDEELPKGPALQAAENALEVVEAEIAEAVESQASAEKELILLEDYAASSSKNSKTEPDVMKEVLALYTAQRKTLHGTLRGLKRDLKGLEQEKEKLRKNVETEKRKFLKENKEKIEEKEKKRLERDERRRERNENRQGRPDSVYRVRILVDLPVPSEQLASADDTYAQEATLVLTYTTSAASWTPHYDLRLDTIDPSKSTLTYRAHFTNTTYETWTNAQLTLSTSQAAFGGLNEKVPKMDPWRISLRKRYNNQLPTDGGLLSPSEQKAPNPELNPRMMQVQQLMQQNIQRVTERGERLDALQDRTDNLAVSAQNFRRGASRARASGGLWNSLAGGYGASAAPPPPAPAVPGAPPTDLLGDIDDDTGDTLAAAANPITHAAAGSDTYGFTTTYELPTPRTIPSSPLVRRHVIAEIALPTLTFTHIAIPKLKTAAFLKARLINTSNIPLLAGAAGLTLDGSFMGSLSFPRCSPDELVVLELGVDQGVRVEYERPTVKHGTQGMVFGKEEVGVYKRSMRITNSKGGPVSLVVLDQVPVPEDERLKVTILVPRGLKSEEDVTKDGVGDGRVLKSSSAPTETSPRSPLATINETTPIKGMERSVTGTLKVTTVGVPTTPTGGGARIGKDWGVARATLRKKGEVRWDLDLVKGGYVSLNLEWECRLPSGESIFAAN